jgi:hypothetical protein
MRSVWFTVVLAALLLASTVAGWAEPPSFLYGWLLAFDNAPVKNQPVVIEGHPTGAWFWSKRPMHEKELRLHVVTDEQGRFQVINLPPGVYTLKAPRLGGEPVLIVDNFEWDGGSSKKQIVGKVSRESLQPQEQLDIKVIPAPKP